MKRGDRRPNYWRGKRKQLKAQAPGQAQHLWGINPLLELLKHAPHKLKRLYLAQGLEGKAPRQLEALAVQAGVEVAWVEREVLEAKAAGGLHQGVLAEIEALKEGTEEELMALAESGEGSGGPVLILDGVEDPQNLGAIARSALAFGARAVVAGKNRSVGLTAGAMKASAGALVQLPFFRVTNLARLLERLKAQGYWTLAAVPGGATGLEELEAGEGRWAVVIGGEGRGVGANLRQHCDFELGIATAGNISSLNASVSAGIVLYALFSQRERREGEGGKRKSKSAQ